MAESAQKASQDRGGELSRQTRECRDAETESCGVSLSAIAKRKVDGNGLATAKCKQHESSASINAITLQSRPS
jgi:hypothetical protein